MNIDIDKGKLDEAVYDDRWLVNCTCGEHWFPSKMMFLKFLEQFDDVKGDASIWSTNDNMKGTTRIYIELEYPVDPEGYMTWKGKVKHDSITEELIYVKAKSFKEAIYLMEEKRISPLEIIEIWHHKMWQPIRWYIEEDVTEITDRLEWDGDEYKG